MEALGAVVTVLGAIYALEAGQLMRGVLGLAVFFLGISILFGSMGAWFLAVGQIFLFVGGVVTLFVLAFSYTETPRQRSHYVPAVLIAALTSVVLYVFLQTGVVVEPAGLREFAHTFFSQYGIVLNVALLVLFSAVITAQYVMTEEPR